MEKKSWTVVASVGVTARHCRLNGDGWRYRKRCLLSSSLFSVVLELMKLVDVRMS